MHPPPESMSAAHEPVLFRNEAYSLTANRLEQPGLTAELEKPDLLVITRDGQRREISIPKEAPAGCPAYRGTIPVLAAMYFLAAHELRSNINGQGLLVAGANWSGVWTRDIAYATSLGAALAEPEACRRSLESRVRDGIILQDTGTGGGWPISCDRVAWALGAWAVNLREGDPAWLAWAADVLIRTLEEDKRFMSADTPLHPGETSFLDWRDQSYPDWMTPAAIGSSFAFNTNTLHCICRLILARMLTILGRKQDAKTYAAEASGLAKAINDKFWSRGTQSYGIMFTRDGFLDEHTDALGTALAVMTGIAGEHAAQAMENLPRSPYGTPVFSPYKTSNPISYHNRSIWPFVEAYVMIAQAELSDLEGCGFSLSSMLRAAMAFGTNKENLNARTGEATDTAQNSDRQLWSTAGMLGAFYYGLFGLRRENDKLVFTPCVPKSYAGSHWLTGLRIRDMVLDIHLNGYGNEVCQVTINGKMGVPILPLSSKGRYLIEFELQPVEDPDEHPHTHLVAKDDLPEPTWDNPSPSKLRWHPVSGATRYCIFKNGTAFACTATCSYTIKPGAMFDVYRIQAESANQISVLSKPYTVVAPGAREIIHPYRIGEEAEYAIERQQAWLDTRPCTSRLDYEDVTLASGTYIVKVLYCNATDSLRDGDTCAIRQLYVDGHPQALIALPHNTERNHWEDYTYSAPVVLHLKSGRHRFSLRYTDQCRNANGDINQCMVRQMEIIRVH